MPRNLVNELDACWRKDTAKARSGVPGFASQPSCPTRARSWADSCWLTGSSSFICASNLICRAILSHVIGHRLLIFTLAHDSTTFPQMGPATELQLTLKLLPVILHFCTCSQQCVVDVQGDQADQLPLYVVFHEKTRISPGYLENEDTRAWAIRSIQKILLFLQACHSSPQTNSSSP